MRAPWSSPSTTIARERLWCGGQRRGRQAPRHAGMHEAGAHHQDPHALHRAARRRDPARARPGRPWTLHRRRSRAGAARPPPRRARRASLRPARASAARCGSAASRLPPMLTWSTSSAPEVSSGRPPRSPRTPTARITMSAPPSSSNRLADDLLVTIEVSGVELERQCPRAAGAGEILGRAGQRIGVAAHERHLARVAALQLSHDRKRDLRGASQHHDTPAGRAGAQRRSQRGLAQSQAPCEVRAQYPVGIHACALGMEAVELGIHGAPSSRVAAGRPSSGRRGRRSRRRPRPARPVPPQPGRAAGRSAASVQPSSGNESGPPNAGPKRLNTARYTGSRRVRMSSKQRSSAASWPEGITNWYWIRPGWAI